MRAGSPITQSMPPWREIDEGQTMLTRRRILTGGACAVVAAPVFARRVFAADSSARAFVSAIYDAYKGKDANGHPLDDANAIRRYFEPTLAAMIIKDQNDAKQRDEVGTLDFDPFVDAQDWEIDAFDIAVTDSGPDKAVATVKFTNSGTPETVILALVKINNQWRISDITWQRDDKSETLRALFAHQ